MLDEIIHFYFLPFIIIDRIIDEQNYYQRMNETLFRFLFVLLVPLYALISVIWYLIHLIPCLLLGTIAFIFEG